MSFHVKSSHKICEFGLWNEISATGFRSAGQEKKEKNLMMSVLSTAILIHFCEDSILIHHCHGLTGDALEGSYREKHEQLAACLCQGSFNLIIAGIVMLSSLLT